MWVQRDQDRTNDSVSPVIIGGNDWAAAWAMDAGRQQPLRGDPGRRSGNASLAYRFGVNLVMYALTGNYKGDQVHVPAILQRLGNDVTAHRLEPSRRGVTRRRTRLLPLIARSEATRQSSARRASTPDAGSAGTETFDIWRTKGKVPPAENTSNHNDRMKAVRRSATGSHKSLPRLGPPAIS